MDTDSRGFQKISHAKAPGRKGKIFETTSYSNFTKEKRSHGGHGEERLIHEGPPSTTKNSFTTGAITPLASPSAGDTGKTWQEAETTNPFDGPFDGLRIDSRQGLRRNL